MTEPADTIPRYQCDDCGGIATEAEMLSGDYFDEELGADLFTKCICPFCGAVNFSLNPGHGWSLIWRLI